MGAYIFHTDSIRKQFSTQTEITMKPFAYLTLFGLFACTPMVFAQDDAAPATTEETAAEDENATEEEPQVDEKALKKAANRYWNMKVARKKKAAGILKKVKDKKSAKKAGKALVKLFDLGSEEKGKGKSKGKKEGKKDGKKDGKKEGKKDAFLLEDNEFMEDAERRYAVQIDKLNAKIEEEKKRIEELDNTAMGYAADEDSGATMNEDLCKGIEAALR